MQQRYKIGVAWYGREQWERLKQVADDKEALDDTYEDWLKGFEELREHSAKQGVEVVKVEVDVDEILKWCWVEDLPMNTSNRASFVTKKLQEMYPPPEDVSKENQCKSVSQMFFFFFLDTDSH